MSINGIEKFTQRTRRLAMAAGALAAVGTAGVLWALPSTASAASVNQTAAATSHASRAEAATQTETSDTKGHASLPFGVSKTQLRHMASGKSSSVASDIDSVQAPSIECYANGTGGTIVAEPWDVNNDGRNTAYFAAVLQWNGASWVYIGAAADPDDGVTVQVFNDSIFGSLAEAPMDLTVNGHGLFEVVYIGQSSGDTNYTYSVGDVVTPQTLYNETTCDF